MPNCIKTGCQVFLMEYHVYLRGDAYVIGAGHEALYYFRLNNRSTSTVMRDEPLHFTITVIDNWFESGQDGTSTLVALHATYHGYDGKMEAEK